MGFIKNSLIGFIVLSIIMVGMYSFLGDLNNTYNAGVTYTNQTGDYNSQIENMSSNIQKKLDVQSISSGGADSIWTNWKILANVFSVLLDVPNLFITSISTSLEVIGVSGWITGIIFTTVTILFALAFLKYVLGKEV